MKSIRFWSFTLLALIALPAAADEPDWSLGSTFATEELGRSIAGIGDINGDGFDDIAMGGPYFENPTQNEGRVLLVLGSPTGLSEQAFWTAEGSSSWAMFGYSLSTAGDVNGDGYDDLLVGARWETVSEDSEGAAYVFFGRPDLPTFGIPDWKVSSGAAHTWFGFAVSGGGDINGDGYDDVVVGAPGFESVAGDHAGRIDVYLGSAEGPSKIAAGSIHGDQYWAQLGFSVAIVGDVNGDGYDDVVAGSDIWDAPAIDDVGRADLYLGGPAGLESEPAWTTIGFEYRAFYGRAVAGAGDVDGDGYDDVLVGADGVDHAGLDGGAVYLYRGTPTGLASEPVWTYYGQPTSRLGFSVDGAGDVNRDGFADIIVGAPWYDDFDNAEGQFELFFGSGVGPAATPDFAIIGPDESGRLGYDVAAAGDVNGDGFPDVIASAPKAERGPWVGGVVFGVHDPGQTQPWVEAGIDHAAEPNITVVKTYEATFADPDSDEFSCRIDWGDGDIRLIDTCEPEDLGKLQHVYGAPGSYLLTISVTDNDGLVGSDTATVTATVPEAEASSYEEPGCACRTGGERASPAVGGVVLLLCGAVWLLRGRRRGEDEQVKTW